MPERKYCEICGDEAGYLEIRVIENVHMSVCPNCKNMGDIPKVERKKYVRATVRRQSSPHMNYSSPPKRAPTQNSAPSHGHSPRKRKARITDYKIVDGVTKILKDFRLKKGLSPHEIAESLKIKENFYKRIEKGTTAMSIVLAKKFEHKYGIKLTELADAEEEEDLSSFMKNNQSSGSGMIYFKKRGKKPEY